MRKTLEGRVLIYVLTTLWLIMYLKNKMNYTKTGKYVKARVSSEINYSTLVKSHIHGNWQEEVYIQICRENMTFTI